jgi:hypothetical protein
MLRTRMFTPGFKLLFGFFGFLMTAAFVGAVATELQSERITVKESLDQKGIVDTLTGPMTIGWKGGVGNQFIYAVLLTAAVAAMGLALLLVAYRDADPDALAEAVQAESVPLTRAPSGASYVPILAAFSILVVGIGWVRSTSAMIAGFVLLIVTAATWTIRAWAERATGDSEVNNEIFKRTIDPVRVPVLAVAMIAFVVLLFSSVLLAVPDEIWSRALFGGVGIVFALAVVLVSRVSRMPRSLIALLLVLGGLAVLVGLIVSSSGGRPIEKSRPEAPAAQSPTGVNA